ncbi:sulfatase-like hydrolase/transferase [Tateyamaria pelophila]|uniref:sulfatase-like hydrolase/transferase n=1 Tax=Tateyamaria pelophila TaxID=328415 RepID=UPI001CBBBCD0
MPRKQKNVILISLDDAISYWHYKNVFGAELIIPNLDRICEQAIAFTSAYCQSPLCGPSRASFMFAKPPHHTGIFGNKRDVFTKVPPTEIWSYKLKQNGYYCSSGGKVHHGYKPLSPDVHEILYTDMRKSFPIDLQGNRVWN